MNADSNHIAIPDTSYNSTSLLIYHLLPQELGTLRVRTTFSDDPQILKVDGDWENVNSLDHNVVKIPDWFEQRQEQSGSLSSLFTRRLSRLIINLTFGNFTETCRQISFTAPFGSSYS